MTTAHKQQATTTPSGLPAHETACLEVLRVAILEARCLMRSAPPSDATRAAFRLLDAIHNLPAAVAGVPFWDAPRVVDALSAYDQWRALRGQRGYAHATAKALLPIYHGVSPRPGRTP